jgi:hypothetical protein
MMWGKKCINSIDSDWHNSNKELPRVSTDVEFMDAEGNIYNGEIVIEMSDAFVYLRHKDGTTGWGSFDKMVKWRFIPGKKYPGYPID